jgi:adenosylcobinamide-GDP ribazoletransferase
MMARFVAAIRFLTIFPFPGQLGSDGKDLAGSTPFFPVVGLGLGFIAAGLSWLFWILFPPFVAAVLMSVVLMGFSGGLHLDGLADTADGFFSARPRKQILEIMRDSRIGAMGVIALIMLLLLKVTALASLDRGQAMRAALLMPVAGRCAIVLVMALLPYARKDGGLASLFYSRRSRWAGIWAFFFFFLFALLTAGRDCLLPMLLFVLTVSVFVLICKKIIGGATGDTLGAACELGEVCTALAFSALVWSSQ